MTEQDKADRTIANTSVANIGHLQQSQDHRLTTAEQKKLTEARGVLLDLIARIASGVEL